MNTFAQRLKQAIEKRNLSQAQAARLCGIRQQSMNYIINNNLNASKLGPQIASALGINPEWLIYGLGKFEETKLYELPIIHSPYMLKKFLNNTLDKNAMDYTTIDVNLGSHAFAYLLEPKKMVLCSQEQDLFDASQYLTLEDATISVTDKSNKQSFPIFEWRTRRVDF